MKHLRVNWREIFNVLGAVALGIALCVGIAYATERAQIIVVHTGETKVLHYNPETHKEVHHEMADGNVMLSVEPKEK